MQPNQPDNIPPSESSLNRAPTREASEFVDLSENQASGDAAISRRIRRGKWLSRGITAFIAVMLVSLTAWGVLWLRQRGDTGNVADKYPSQNIGLQTGVNNPPLATSSTSQLAVNGDVSIAGVLSLSPQAIDNLATALTNKITLQATYPGTPQAGNANITGTIGAGNANIVGTVTAGSFAGNGARLSALNADNLTTGTVNDARLSPTVTRLGQSIPLSSIQGNVVSSINGLTGGNLDLVAGTNVSIAASGTSITISTNLPAAGIGTISVGTGLTGGGSGSSVNVGVDGAIVTMQGNTFNAAGQLVQLNGSGALPAVDGSLLSSLNASALSSGTINDARLSTNVTVQGNTFNGALQLVRLNGATELPAVSGANLTNLNASNITVGTLPDVRLSTNVTLQGNTFNLPNKLLQLDASGYLPVLNGSNLTNLNATNISSGTLDDARLSTNVALLSANQSFSGSNTFTQPISVNSLQPTAAMTVGATSQSLALQGNLSTTFSASGGAGSATLGFLGTPTGIVRYNLDAATTPGTYTICTTVGNCSSVGGGVTTLGGTTNRLSKFTGSQSVGDSSISDTGSLVTINSRLNIQPAVDNTQAVQVTNAAGTVTYFTVDSINGRVAIGNISPSYTLDVNGDINSATGLRVGGNLVCNSSGCNAGSGSGFYIQNGISLQSGANFNIESNTTSSVVGILKGKSGQTADLFQAKDGTGAIVAKIDVSGNYDITGQYRIGGSQIASSNLSDVNNLAKLNAAQTFTGSTNTFKNGTNSSSAFQIQNAAGTSNLFIADTTNTRIGIGKASPGYTLDVNGDINIASGSYYRINGVAICGPTASCAPSAGSNSYIQNSTAQQTSANFNIQSTSAASVVGILQGASSQTADLLQARDASNTILAKIDAAGNVTATSFAGTGSGLTSLNASNVSSGTLNDARLSTNVTVQGNTFNGASQLVQLDGSGYLPALNASALTNLNATNLSSGTVADARLSTNVTLQGNTFNGASQLVQLNASSQLPVVSGVNLTNLNASNLSSGTVSDSRLSANVALLNANQTFSGNNTFTGSNQIFRNSTNSTTAFQIQNALSVQQFVVDTTTGNTTTLGAGTFGNGNVIVGSGSNSVRIGNSALYDASWAAIGSTRPSFTINPSDYAGTSGSNEGLILQQNFNPTTGSAKYIGLSVKPTINQTGSASGDYTALQIRPTVTAATGTNRLLVDAGTTANPGQFTISDTGKVKVQNSANSTTAFQIQNAAGTNMLVADTTNSRVAINQASASYTLDVNGDVNVASGASYRINGTAICTSSGCTAASGSGNYIQNGTSLQTTANFNIESAAVGSVTGVLKARASQTADILQLKDTAAANVLSVGSGGKTVFKTSTNDLNGFQVQNSAGGSIFNLDTTNTALSFNAAASGELTSPWTSSPNVMSTGVKQNGVVVLNGYIYSFGGTNSGGSSVTTVQYAQLNTDGTTGAWSTTTALPSASSVTGAVVNNGYIYVAQYASANIFYAKPNPDGTISSWTTSGSQSPSVTLTYTDFHPVNNLVVANGYLYITNAGNAGSATAHTNIYYAKLNADGSVGAITASANNLPAALNYPVSVVSNGYLVVMAGYNNSSALQTTVYTFPLNPATGAPGAVTTTTSLPIGNGNGTGFVLNGNVYYVPSGSSTLYYGKVTSTGTIASWTTASNTLTQTLANTATVTNNGYVYFVGGTKAGASVATVTYVSGARVQITGNLDLIGMNSVGYSNAANGSTGGSIYAGKVAATGGLDVNGLSQLNGDLSVTGNATFTSNANSTSAFLIQNSTSNAVFNADTSNRRIGIGTNTPTAALDIRPAAVGDIGLYIKQFSGSTTADYLQFQNSSSVIKFAIDATGAIAVGDALGGPPVFGVDPNSGTTPGALTGTGSPFSPGCTAGCIGTDFLSFTQGVAYTADLAQTGIYRCYWPGGNAQVSGTGSNQYWYVYAGTTMTTNGRQCVIAGASGGNPPTFNAKYPYVTLATAVVNTSGSGSTFNCCLLDRRFFLGGTLMYVNSSVAVFPGAIVVNNTGADNSVSPTTSAASTGVAGLIVAGNSAAGTAIMMTSGVGYAYNNGAQSRASCVQTSAVSGAVQTTNTPAVGTCLGHAVTAPGGTTGILVRVAPY